MPLPVIPKDFYFLAYIDIAGFKNMMELNKNKSIEVLNDFYQIGYNCLADISINNRSVVGQFFSDMGLLISREQSINKIDQLEELIRTVVNINEAMYRKNSCFVTTSIGYGEFQYYQRDEHNSIGKTPVYGKGFVDVYMDNEKTHPKLIPGSSRILKKNLPSEVKIFLENHPNRFHRSIQHYYFYWLTETENLLVKEVHAKFKETEKRVKFKTDNITSKAYRELIKSLVGNLN